MRRRRNRKRKLSPIEYMFKARRKGSKLRSRKARYYRQMLKKYGRKRAAKLWRKRYGKASVSW